MIALFSATGNTRLIARSLAPMIGETRIDDILSLTSEAVRDERRIIWAFPIHAWGVPGVIEEAIGRLSFHPSTHHYMLVTCGDDIGRADRLWAELVESRGGRAMGAFSILMPDTYVILPGFDVDSPDLMASKLNAAPGRLKAIAEAINRGEPAVDVKPGPFPGLKSGFLRWFFRRFLITPKPFRVDTHRCTACGACARACPIDNVSRDTTGRPVWGEKCLTCMACYHACPTHAVEYGKRTKRKGQYRCPRALPH